MKRLHLMLIIFSVLGCSENISSNSNSSDAKESKETVFDGHLNALEKTREIENVLQQGANQRQQEIDEQY